MAVVMAEKKVEEEEGQAHPHSSRPHIGLNEILKKGWLGRPHARHDKMIKTFSEKGTHLSSHLGQHSTSSRHGLPVSLCHMVSGHTHILTWKNSH